jgi:hypothetical protein
VVSDASVLTPVIASGSSLTGVTQLVYARLFACALPAGGTPLCWGSDRLTTFPTTTTPMPVSGLAGVTAIAATTDTICALLAGGTVSCWGDNASHVLGNSSAPYSPTPVPEPGVTGAKAIAAGAGFACALKEGGTVDCWGDSLRVGRATPNSTASPVAAPVSACTSLLGCCYAMNTGGMLGPIYEKACLDNYDATVGDDSTCALAVDVYASSGKCPVP